MVHFELKEFDSPDLPGSGGMMTDQLLTQLDRARTIAGIPFKINSGFRTKSHNTAINGSPTSSHLNGSAVDIHCVDSGSRQKIVDSLISAGFKRLGIANTFIHADMDKNKNPAIWLYQS